MKKIIVMSAGALLLLSSCGTYTGEGAYVGGSFGSILGSAIGGISGGPRGSDIGTIVGMAGGAVLGAAIGAQADQQNQRGYDQQSQRVYGQRQQQGTYDQADNGYQDQTDGQQMQSDNQQNQTYNQQNQDQSGFDQQNSGDDRVSLGIGGPAGAAQSGSTVTYKGPQANTVSTQSISVDQLLNAGGYSIKYNPAVEIRNAQFLDADKNGILKAGEECRISFEIMNNSEKPLYDVQPTVLETTGNKHIHISHNLHIESIMPNKGVRYTATLMADSRLKDGQAQIRIAVAQGNREITSQIKEFTIQTVRK